MTRLTTLCLIAVALIGGGAGTAETAPLDDSQEAEWRRKADEVERLRKELDQQEAELKRLRQENERLRKQKMPPPPAGARAAAVPRSVAPIASLPPLAAGAVVEAGELVGHFVQEPAAAALRYGGKEIRVRGEVLRFGRGLVTRDYTLVLGSGDPAEVIACNFNYADSYAAVYPKRNGGELVARTRNGGEIPLARAGQVVIVAGRCKGFKDGEVRLTGCALVP
jgi:hypothetical protein